MTPQMRAFRELAGDFGMAALVEVHDAGELDARPRIRAPKSSASTIAICARSRSRSKPRIDLAPRFPPASSRSAKAASSLRPTSARLMDAGYDAFLVGEHLVKSGDPARALRELVA